MNVFGSRITFARALPFLTLLVSCTFSHSALADQVIATYLSPGAEVPVSTFTYESFTGLTYNGISLTTNYGNSSPGAITGTYSGSVSLLSADQYGGTGGVGTYIAATNGNSYTVTFDQEANYFGLWFSALDDGNEMQFYENQTLVFSFTPADFSTLVGSCPSNSGFCGNPSGTYAGDDGSQQYAYLAFYDQDGSFNGIKFSEDGGGNFESDNHSVAFLTPPTPQGTVIAATPEPSAVALLGTGLAGVAGMLRRRGRSIAG